MKFLKRLVLLLLVLLVVLVIVGYMLPKERELERSVVIDASPEQVFSLINDFREFNRWSPWAQIDPEGTQYEFSGPPAGTGAIMSWTSEHPNVGSGTQKILESVPFEKIRTELRFGGFETPAFATFTLQATDEGTEVTWAFESEMDGLIGRYMGLMLDKWVGADYERGLALLKELTE